MKKHLGWRAVVAYAVLVSIAFVAFNPSIWRDPINRLIDMLFFHLRYTQGEAVRNAAYPWYQPFIWLAFNKPAESHLQVFFNVGWETFIFIAGLIGLRWEWCQRRWVVIWVVASLVFLLAWPTKGPHYPIVLLPAWIALPVVVEAAGSSSKLMWQISKAWKPRQN